MALGVSSSAEAANVVQIRRALVTNTYPRNSFIMGEARRGMTDTSVLEFEHPVVSTTYTTHTSQTLGTPNTRIATVSTKTPSDTMVTIKQYQQPIQGLEFPWLDNEILSYNKTQTHINEIVKGGMLQAERYVADQLSFVQSTDVQLTTGSSAAWTKAEQLADATDGADINVKLLKLDDLTKARDTLITRLSLNPNTASIRAYIPWVHYKAIRDEYISETKFGRVNMATITRAELIQYLGINIIPVHVFPMCQQKADKSAPDSAFATRTHYDASSVVNADKDKHNTPTTLLIANTGVDPLYVSIPVYRFVRGHVDAATQSTKLTGKVNQFAQILTKDWMQSIYTVEA